MLELESDVVVVVVVVVVSSPPAVEEAELELEESVVVALEESDVLEESVVVEESLELDESVELELEEPPSFFFLMMMKLDKRLKHGLMHCFRLRFALSQVIHQKPFY